MHELICTYCGTANPAEAQFCIECGAGVAAAATGATVRLPSKRCASCGGEAPPIARFCPLCGKPYAAEAAPCLAPTPDAPRAGTTPTRPGGPSTWQAGWTWSLLALLGGLLLFLLTRGKVLILIAPLALAGLGLGLSRQAFRSQRQGRAVMLAVFWLGLALLVLLGKLWPGLLVVGLLALAAGWLASHLR
jgi:hypothetical protein